MVVGCWLLSWLEVRQDYAKIFYVIKTCLVLTLHARECNYTGAAIIGGRVWADLSPKRWIPWWVSCVSKNFFVRIFAFRAIVCFKTKRDHNTSATNNNQQSTRKKDVQKQQQCHRILHHQASKKCNTHTHIDIRQPYATVCGLFICLYMCTPKVLKTMMAFCAAENGGGLNTFICPARLMCQGT